MINASGLHDVIFENLTFQNAHWAHRRQRGANLVIRRCVIRDVDYGLVATRNTEAQQHILIADNVMIGRSTWPRSQGIEDRRGVQISGTGNVVCYNRIRGFADAIDTFSTYPCSAIDFYGNEISECTDDGIEMDLLGTQHALFRQPADERVSRDFRATGPRRTGLRVPQCDLQRRHGNVQDAQPSLGSALLSQHVGQGGHAA